jgi:hypothetical protein
MVSVDVIVHFQKSLIVKYDIKQELADKYANIKNNPISERYLNKQNAIF